MDSVLLRGARAAAVPAIACLAVLASKFLLVELVGESGVGTAGVAVVALEIAVFACAWALAWTMLPGPRAGLWPGSEDRKRV